MKNERLNGEHGGPEEISGHSIEDTAALYGLNPWTVRMWVDRFETLERSADPDGNPRLSPRAVEQIGEIHRLAKNGMKLDEVRQYLDPGGGE